MSFAEIQITRVKEYWDQRPCNIRHSPKPVGTKEFFDEVEARKYYVESHIPSFAEFERWRGKKVLEIGCGIGTDTVSFAGNGALVTSVDFSEKSLLIAQKRVSYRSKVLEGCCKLRWTLLSRDNRALATLASRVGATSGLAEATDLFNRAQIKSLAEIVKSYHFGTDAIGVLSLTYKPNTDVVEESFGFLLAQGLSSSLAVIVFDPSVDAGVN